MSLPVFFEGAEHRIYFTECLCYNCVCRCERIEAISVSVSVCFAVPPRKDTQIVVGFSSILYNGHTGKHRKQSRPKRSVKF